MADFRYTLTTIDGRTVQGFDNSRTLKAAKKNVTQIAEKNSMNFVKVEKKRTFIYKIQRGDEKPLRGEQRAFSREDVVNAIQKRGYKVLRIEKKLFDIRLRPPSRDVVIFIRMCADLLREKFAYDEILTLLMNDIENKTLRNAVREINQDLKDGKEGKEVFFKHQNILGKFPAYMLSIASTSGDMASIYENTAKFMERNEDFKKSLRQALLMPMMIVFFLFLAVLFYVAYIFPKTAELFLKYDIDLPPMTQFTMDASNFLKDNVFSILFLLAAIILVVFRFLKSRKGRLLFDRFLIRVPVVGTLMHKTSIEIFSRVFNALYTGSGDNIAVLRVAAEACRNSFMEMRVKDVALQLMVKEGFGLVEALEKSGVFTKNALAQLRSGSETGTLKAVSLQLANYYEKETTYKLRSVIDMVNVSVSMFIMVVMIGLTIVSSETAVIKPQNPIFR